jgi:hypothetical protein
MTLPITKNALGAKLRAFFTHCDLFRVDEWISPMDVCTRVAGDFPLRLQIVAKRMEH